MTKIIQRNDTAANWTSVNPVLAAGEMGVETDTNKFKIGNGLTDWQNLPYTDKEVQDKLDKKQDKLVPTEPINIEQVTIEAAVGLDTTDLNNVIITTYTGAKKSTTYWFTSSKYNTPYSGTFMEQLAQMGYLIQEYKQNQIIQHPSALGYLEDGVFIPVLYFRSPSITENSYLVPALVSNFNKNDGTYTSSSSSNQNDYYSSGYGKTGLVQVLSNYIFYGYGNYTGQAYFPSEELSKITHVLFVSYVSGDSSTSWTTNKIGYPYKQETYDRERPFAITNSLDYNANHINIGIFDGIEGLTISSAEGIPSDPINLINLNKQIFNSIYLAIDNTTIGLNSNGQLTCTLSDAPFTGVSAPLKLSGDTVYVPEMTGPTTEGFTVTASRFSTEYSSQYYKCFNADGYGWYAGNKKDGSDYIQIVFPRRLHLRGADIKQNVNSNSLVSNYALLITQNGTDWTEVLSDILPQTENYVTSKIINSDCLGFRFRADGNYATNGAAISNITLDLTELPTTATLAYDDSTLKVNENGQLTCTSNMLSESNFINFCTANADAIKAALGLS